MAGVLLVLLLPSAAVAAPATYKGSAAGGGVVFFETEERLVSGDNDNKRDIYERSFDPDVEGGTYVTRQVSTGPTGGNDAYNALFEGNSPDGERAFFSTEESLVGADKDKRTDVYMRELSGATALLSVAADSCSGTCGNSEAADASYVGASADGSVVFFTTNEPLDEADGDTAFDLYAYDLGTEKTELVSRPAPGCTGSCGNGNAPAVYEGSSEDGNVVYFTTTESLDPGDGDQFQDIYRRGLSTSLVTPSGTCPSLDCDALFRGTTPSGGSVFFQTTQPIDSADGDEDSDLYVWSGGTVDLASRPDPSCGTCANEHKPATFAAASADGTKVIFQTSEALAGADTDTATDVYERDLGAEVTSLVSPDATCPLPTCNSEYRATSSDGNLVFFQTAERLDPGDSDSAVDLYLRNLETEATSFVSAPAPGCTGCGNGDTDAKFGALAAGATEVFFSTADALVESDEDEAVDVYQRNLGATPSTVLVTPDGVCPLPGEEECDSSFEGVSDNGTQVVFSTIERLDAIEGEDSDSEPDVYARAAGKTRLISTGNSVELGPSTPILTATSPASPNPSLEPFVMGASDPGTSIKIYSTPDCSGAPVKNGIGTAADFTGIGIRVTIEPGSTTIFRATATDANGDTSECSASGLKYQQAETPVTPPAEESGGGGTPGGTGDGPTTGSGTGIQTVTGSGSKSGGGGSIGKAQPVVPQTRITFGPASKTRARRPVFRFTDATGQGGTEFRCRVDSGRWKGCSSPYRSKRLSPGKHSFSVKGANSGLLESHPVSRRFKVVRP